MPLYEYQCHCCHHHFTLLQSMSDTAIPACVKCKKNDTVERLISNSSFILKGSGWFDSGYQRTNQTQSDKDTDSTTNQTSSVPDKASQTNDQNKTDKTEKKDSSNE